MNGCTSKLELVRLRLIDRIGITAMAELVGLRKETLRRMFDFWDIPDPSERGTKKRVADLVEWYNQRTAAA